MTKKEALDATNALPFDVRTIVSAHETVIKIQQLRAEKRRLSKSYRRSAGKINDNIGKCEEWIAGLVLPVEE